MCRYTQTGACTIYVKFDRDVMDKIVAQRGLHTAVYLKGTAQPIEAGKIEPVNAGK
jgi:hypothetical protein